MPPVAMMPHFTVYGLVAAIVELCWSVSERCLREEEEEEETRWVAHRMIQSTRGQRVLYNQIMSEADNSDQHQLRQEGQRLPGY